jgi:hypothetical protein
MSPAEQNRFATALAGEVMGSGPKKGYTYRWIPARLRDAGGAIVPRSLLRLLGHAAKGALRKGVASRGPLMDPTELVGALQTTSANRVAELGDEYKLVKRLEHLEHQTVLMARDEVVDLLRRPRPEDDGYDEDGEAVVEELIRIGVLEVRSDGRIDVPDIYRYGYGIKRKGGAKAPR